MNSKNAEISDLHRLIINLTDEINLKRSDNYVTLSNLNIYYASKNKKKSYIKNEFKISMPTWNDKFELPHGSYSLSDIQDYFEYIIKKHETITDNQIIRIHVNKIENKITFKIKTA